MIYLGWWSNFDVSSKVHKLGPILKQHLAGEPTLTIKDNLVLVYGKKHPKHDVDQIWESDSTILIGHIFDKELNKALELQEFSELAKKHKQDLTKKIWGKYVYWYMEEPNKIEIRVDPAGQLSCYYYRFPNGDLLFSSHIHLISSLVNLDYNWNYLCSYLFYGDSSAIETPFNGVEEIPPGCSLCATHNSIKVTSFWNLFSTYKDISPVSTNSVDVLQAVLKPMIEPYQNVCVSLSGGLDSSSLVYCLSEIIHSSQRLIALNYFHSKVKSSNELQHAYRVCKEVGIELIEVDSSKSLPFDTFTMDYGLRMDKPSSACINLATAHEISRYLSFDDSCILLSGHGGDNLFMRPPTKNSIADYLLTKGTKGLISKIKDIAHFYRDSLTPILIQNMIMLVNYILAKNSKQKRAVPLDKPPCWFMPQIHQYKTDALAHPVYGDIPSSLLPGKYDQIDNIYEGLAVMHENPNIHISTHYPFLCESVINFACSFPTYDLFRNGYDRYPLRQSVSSRFKTDTVWRLDKGETTGILQLGVKKNISYVLELCLEGELVKQGIVDKEGLRKTILLISNGDNNDLWPFINVASIEEFLRMWARK